MFDTPVFKVLSNNDTIAATRCQHQYGECELTFWNWFGASAVVDQAGYPVTVYRGEHGPTKTDYTAFDQSKQWGHFQTRLGSLSFGSEWAAKLYATKPNNSLETPTNPRVHRCYLSIRNPAMNQPNDPFIELAVIERIFDRDTAISIAIEMSAFIVETSIWQEEIGLRHTNVASFLRQNLDGLNYLYFNAYAFFDQERYVSMLKSKGFDGAIHGGCGENLSEPEYKVFDASNVWPISVFRIT